MLPKTFEEVWFLLRELEGTKIQTLSRPRWNRIGTFGDGGMTRQTESKSGGGWKPQKPIRRKDFENLWMRLSTGRDLEIRDVPGYIFLPAACFVKVKALGVEMVKPWPLTLRLTHTGTQITNRNNAEVNDEEDDEEFGDLERIVVDPDICSGKPTIRGTRIMVSNILGMFAGGYSIPRIQKSYQELSRLDVISAVEYASRVVDGEKTVGQS